MKNKTDKEILKKVIAKVWREPTDEELEDLITERFSWVHQQRYMGVIFSHQFAKLLWGEKPFEFEIEVGPEGGKVYDVATLPAWEYHLQQMVLSEDPLKYLATYA